MKLYADASVHRGVIIALRSKGVDVLSGAEEHADAIDTAVLGAATDLGRILVTEDKDFGDLVVRKRLPARGVILLRATPTSAADAARVADRVISALAQAEGAIVTITSTQVRSRPLPSRPLP